MRTARPRQGAAPARASRPGALQDGGAASLADPGTFRGADRTEAEPRYLVRAEWARRAPDVLWRRSKLGLRLSKAEAAVRVDEALWRILTRPETAAA